MSEKRVKWFQEYQDDLAYPDMDLLNRAYQLFLRKLSISAEDAPIVKRDSGRLVIHSQNFCPTLAACDILGLDTRRICAHMTEEPMDALLKQLDPRLCFSRNYGAIRPHTEYCEEIISLAKS